MTQDKKITKKDLARASVFLLEGGDNRVGEVMEAAEELFEEEYLNSLITLCRHVDANPSHIALAFTLIVLSMKYRNERTTRISRLTDRWVFWFTVGILVVVIWYLIVLATSGG